MLEFFHFLVDYQLWIYAVLGVLALIYLKRLITAWQERYNTIFGLERENAQWRLNSALAVFVLLLLLIAAEFVLVTFVIPEWPQVMATPTPTPAEGEAAVSEEGTAEGEEDLMIVRNDDETGLVINSTPEGSEASTTTSASTGGGCVEGQLEWLEPVNGEEISGSYTLMATVNVRDMAFYHYAFSPVDDQQEWQTLSAGNLPVVEGELGLWATTQVDNGDYILRLTVYDLSNNALTPCDIQIRVFNEE